MHKLTEKSLLMEAQYVKELGYTPTHYIEEWEWEAELKRLNLSNDQEKVNEPKS